MASLLQSQHLDQRLCGLCAYLGPGVTVVRKGEEDLVCSFSHSYAEEEAKEEEEVEALGTTRKNLKTLTLTVFSIVAQGSPRRCGGQVRVSLSHSLTHSLSSRHHLTVIVALIVVDSFSGRYICWLLGCGQRLVERGE